MVLTNQNNRRKNYNDVCGVTNVGLLYTHIIIPALELWIHILHLYTINVYHDDNKKKISIKCYFNIQMNVYDNFKHVIIII